MRKIMTLTAGALLAGCTPGGSQTNVEQNVTVEANVAAVAPANETAPIASAETPANATALPEDLQAADSRSVGCEAYLAHYLDQASPAEKAPVEAAMKAWRAKLETEMTKDEAAQFFASTYAVDRDVPAATVKSAAQYCLANKP